MFALDPSLPACVGVPDAGEIQSIGAFIRTCRRNAPNPRPSGFGAGSRAYVPIDCWYSVKPIPAQTAAMIQKRSMIFVSDQAISSKW